MGGRTRSIVDSRPSLQKRKALVVDDDPTVRDVVAWVLQHAGIVVTTAADGHQAEAALEEGRFDVIVLDLEMPGRTGYDVLTSAGPERPPVLVLSGSLETEEKARRSGAGAFAVKPIRATALLEQIRELVDPRRS